jgi:hypothetical protein
VFGKGLTDHRGGSALNAHSPQEAQVNAAIRADRAAPTELRPALDKQLQDIGTAGDVTLAHAGGASRRALVGHDLLIHLRTPHGAARQKPEQEPQARARSPG